MRSIDTLASRQRILNHTLANKARQKCPFLLSRGKFRAQRDPCTPHNDSSRFSLEEKRPVCGSNEVENIIGPSARFGTAQADSTSRASFGTRNPFR
jgi:hypothetical protein